MHRFTARTKGPKIRLLWVEAGRFLEPVIVDKESASQRLKFCGPDSVRSFELGLAGEKSISQRSRFCEGMMVCGFPGYLLTRSPPTVCWPKGSEVSSIESILGRKGYLKLHIYNFTVEWMFRDSTMK